ncbi:MAG: A/G-specific adenine glycosylase [Bacteroidales bacterium]|jgi:A/G-specific adenine glycosylase|nr:A/G-specific adenine glycosylase [Bacteroidales bacterium]
MQVDNFSTILLQWYEKHKRELPWRGEKTPYKIWISEIILQQTRVAQGWDYYVRFVERFPSVSELALASQDEVLKYWQGLGYYSRARNLHAGAKYIMEKHHGIFPQKHADILRIKGVGEYTAAAIASLAFGLPYPAVDGNVFRVLTRIFGIETPVDTSKGKKEITALANRLIDKKRAGTFNQAIMDFGSLQCVPSNPDCEKCCFAAICYAKANNRQAALPFKRQKTTVRNRYFYYFFIQDNGDTFLQKRTEKDIWQGLYEFPLIESDTELLEEAVFSQPLFLKWTDKCQWRIEAISSVYKHQLSHQLIVAKFFTLSVRTGTLSLDKNSISLPLNTLSDYPVSRLIEKFL